MKVGNCVDEHDHGDSCCIKVGEDGRRIKETVAKRDLGDGTRECVHEEFVEVVPMRLKTRTSRKLAEVPIEKKVETFSCDGTSVDVQVEAVDAAALELGHQPPTIEALAADVHALREKMDHKVCKCKDKARKPFLGMAKARYAGHAAPVEEEIEVRTGSKMEVVLTTIGWAAFAVVAGLLTYAVI
jgi:hypothetical protein